MKFKVNSGLSGGTNNREKGVECIIDTKKGNQTLNVDICLLSIG